MSVSDWFSTFHGNLAITKADSISYRYKRITRQVEEAIADVDAGNFASDEEIDHVLHRSWA